jgi:acetyl esterase/lipase
MNAYIGFLVLTLSTFQPCAAEWLPLWPGEAPGGARPPVFTENVKEGGRMTDITVPQYEVHLPEVPLRTGAAVVIFPGGGYGMLAMGHEGREYAAWLVKHGITAVIVKYRVSGDDRAGYQFPVPLMDARRAIRLTRSKAAEWGVDPAKVGVMGSSAGGHLASMCATLWDEKIPAETSDAIDAVECRPDFAVLVYPVISMTEKWGHGGSKRRLLGDNPDAQMAERLSTDRRVNAKTPPCFLACGGRRRRALAQLGGIRRALCGEPRACGLSCFRGGRTWFRTEGQGRLRGLARAAPEMAGRAKLVQGRAGRHLNPHGVYMVAGALEKADFPSCGRLTTVGGLAQPS